jgi:hypothetical protein
MAKRKAKDLQDTIPAEEPRRSSRRVSTAKEEVVLDKKSKSTPTPKTAKKAQKPAKAVSTAVNAEGGKSSSKIVSSPNTYSYAFLLCKTLLPVSKPVTCVKITKVQQNLPSRFSSYRQLT